MKYEGITLTRNNYKSVLEGYDDEILEIVELCIKDNTDIGPFIARCKSDGYRLWEIRQCIKQNMPRQLYEKIRFPKVLQKLRKSKRSGEDIKSILSLLSTKYTEQAMLCVIDLVGNGYDLKGYNLTFVADECLDIFTHCVKEKVDIHEYINKKGAMDKNIFSRIVSIARKGMEIDFFIEDNWTSYQLDVIIENLAYTDDTSLYTRILPFIKPDSMNPYYIEQAIQLVKKGMTPEDVFKKRLSELIASNTAIETGVRKEEIEGSNISEDDLRIKTKIEKRKRMRVRTL